MVIDRLYPEAGALADTEALEAHYAFRGDRYVRANMVASVDGAVELHGRSGPLGGPADRLVFAVLRGLADVVLVGAGTARSERYGPVRLDSGTQARRRRRGQAPLPPLAVLTERGDLEPGLRLFDPAAPRPLVLAPAAAARGIVGRLGERAEVIACGDRTVDPRFAVDALARRGLTRVLCEGGPSTLAALLGAGLLDELCLTHSPVLAGGGRAGLLGGHELAGPVPVRLLGLAHGGGFLLARYGLRSDASAASVP